MISVDIGINGPLRGNFANHAEKLFLSAAVAAARLCGLHGVTAAAAVDFVVDVGVVAGVTVAVDVVVGYHVISCAIDGHQ